MSAPETPFTDHSAVVRGLQVIQREAPLFAAHIEQERRRMERVAEEVIRTGFPQTGNAMSRFAHDL